MDLHRITDTYPSEIGQSSLGKFKLGVKGITIRREATDCRDGKILILPSGLSNRHFSVIKAALESDYRRGTEVLSESEDSTGKTVWRINLKKWGIKYFDMALEWQVHEKLVFTRKCHHQHFDDVAKRIRCLQFARDLGLDGMCMEIYRQLYELVYEVYEGCDAIYLSGYFVRKLLEHSECWLIDDEGSSLRETIPGEQNKIEEDMKKREQDLALVKRKLEEELKKEPVTIDENYARVLTDLKNQHARLEEQVKWLEDAQHKLSIEAPWTVYQ